MPDSLGICPYCFRDILYPPGSIRNKFAEFFLTPLDLERLKSIKKTQFDLPKSRRKVVLGLMSRPVRSPQGMRFSDNLDLPAGENTFTEHKKAVENIERRFDGLKRQFEGWKGGINLGKWDLHDWWTYDPKEDHDDLLANRKKNEPIIWRIQIDHPANIKDVIWVFQKSQLERRRISAIFLHKNSFMWVACPGPTVTDRSPQGNDTVDSHIEVVSSNLMALWQLKRANLDRVNEILGHSGRVQYHKYPKLGAFRHLEEEFHNVSYLKMTFGIGVALSAMYAYNWAFGKRPEQFAKGFPAQPDEAHKHGQTGDAEKPFEYLKDAKYEGLTEGGILKLTAGNTQLTFEQLDKLDQLDHENKEKYSERDEIFIDGEKVEDYEGSELELGAGGAPKMPGKQIDDQQQQQQLGFRRHRRSLDRGPYVVGKHGENLNAGGMLKIGQGQGFAGLPLPANPRIT